MSDRHWEWLHYSKHGTLSSFIFQKEGGHNGRVVLPMQSVPITTNVVSLNPTHGEVYWIQHYVIKFVSDLRKVVGFLHVLWFPPPIQLTIFRYNWNIVESGVKQHNPNPNIHLYNFLLSTCSSHIMLCSA